jgi:predicted  nucleic acid-binding Zn-ribbon protein
MINAVIQNLLKLQALEFSDETNRQQEAQIAEYRALVPAQILGHYDRLRVRGKKGVAVIRNSTCSGCHMKQPVGKIAVLIRGEDVQLCDSCGRYLYMPDAAESQFVENVAASQPAPAKAAKKSAKPRRKAEPVIAA